MFFRKVASTAGTLVALVSLVAGVSATHAQAEDLGVDTAQYELEVMPPSCNVPYGEIADCVNDLAGLGPTPPSLSLGPNALPYQSALELQFDDGTVVSGDAAWLRITENAVGPEEGNGGSTQERQPIYCNTGNYRFYDRNGTYDLRYNCPFNNSQWAFQLSSNLQNICTGTVNEIGARWYRNGVQKPANSSHVGYPCDYRFHGTFSPTYNRDGVDWYDVLTFRCNVGGKRCSARVSAGGSFQTLK